VLEQEQHPHPNPSPKGEGLFFVIKCCRFNADSIGAGAGA
jgi:hypothetical protein